MRLPKVLCASLLVIVLAASAPAQENRTDQPESGEYVPVPRLVVNEVEHNFGEVRAGRVLRWVFKIKNVGTADLLILSVAPSWGTKGDFDKVVPPGQEGRIELFLVGTSGYAGNVSRFAQVSTNDPRKRRFNLTVRANFTPKPVPAPPPPPAAERPLWRVRLRPDDGAKASASEPWLRWAEEPGRTLARGDLGAEVATVGCSVGEDRRGCPFGLDATDFRLAAVWQDRIFLYQA